MNPRGTFSLSAIDATAYVALSGVIGFVSFLFLVIVLAISIPLLIVALAGLPGIWLALAYCHGLALAEGRRAAALMGARFPVRRLPTEGSYARRTWQWMRSRGSWLELLYAGVALPFVGWLGAVLVFIGWGAALAFLSFPLWGWAADGHTLGLAYVPSAVVHVAAG